jgi:hypothetical protein
LHGPSIPPRCIRLRGANELRAEVARVFFEGIVRQATAAGLLVAEHFTVEGTLIEAWAPRKSLRPKGERRGDRPQLHDLGNPTANSTGSGAATRRTPRSPTATRY